MILDPEPRPVVDTVPIEIPSEKTPFSPRLSLPPVPDPGNVPVAPPPDTAAPADEAKAAEGAAADKPEKPADKPDEKAAEKPATKAPARPTTEARPREAKAGGRILLQAAALGSEGAARELVDRLKAAGFAPTIERVATKEGVRWRVRVGPYATRDESERAREQLKALGINAVRVAPEK
jgi:DedD protein